MVMNTISSTVVAGAGGPVDKIQEARPAGRIVRGAGADVGVSEEELMLHLGTYRTLLEGGWSQATIHPRYEFGTSPAPSVGQCGVSSAWLTIELQRRFGWDSEYCFGDVVTRPDPSDGLEHHCWVEIVDASTAERWVVDVTCDQIQRFRGHPILLREHSELRACDVDYVSSSRIVASQVRRSAIGHRLDALESALRANRR